MKLTSAAAATQLASIRVALNSMLTEIVLSSASGEAAEFTDYSEEELLKIFAVQLEGFVQQFKGTDEAEGARSLLARIYVKLNKIDLAVKVLKDLDADRAEKSDLLQLALNAGHIVELGDSVENWLKVVGTEGEVWDKRLDAVFIAVNLNKWDLAAQLLQDTRQDAKTSADKAALAVAEADLVMRVGVVYVIPVNTPSNSTSFLVDAVVAAKLNANEAPIGSWKQIKTTAVPANWADAAKAAEDQRRRDEELKKSDVYKQLVLDAAPGLRTLVALKDVDDAIDGTIDGTWAPPTDDQLPPYMPPANVVAKALLYKAVHKYPGTDGAKDAGIMLHAGDIQVGDFAVAFDTMLLDGKKLHSSDLLGKVVLLDFFSVSDYDSIVERKQLAKLYQTYNAQGFEIVSVSLDDDASRALVQAAADGFEMNWPIVFDGNGVHAEIATKYGVQAVPARLLIAPDGTVFEDKAWHLSPDQLEGSILNALAKPKTPPPPVEIVYNAEKRYYGPEVHVNLVPAPDGTNVQINADVWVADSGYKLNVIKVDPKPDGVKVYLGLELQQWQNSSNRNLLSVKVPVPADIMKVTKFVKVYVDHKKVDEPLEPAPLLAKVVPIDPTSIAPMWPNVELELISTNSIPPEFTAMLTTDLLLDQYSVDVNSIDNVDRVTQIKLVVTPKKTKTGVKIEGTVTNAPTGNADADAAGNGGNAEIDEKEVVRLVIPLGSDVARTIDVLVAKVEANGTVGPFSVVTRHIRNF
ncbi:MAG TPA: TlpA disulfide reductase family protein [Planctomycetota bacterium]